jgi:hypothetical protein
VTDGQTTIGATYLNIVNEPSPSGQQNRLRVTLSLTHTSLLANNKVPACDGENWLAFAQSGSPSPDRSFTASGTAGCPGDGILLSIACLVSQNLRVHSRRAEMGEHEIKEKEEGGAAAGVVPLG